MTHHHSRTARRLVRGALVGTFLSAVAFGAPAFADTPEAWQTEKHVSGLDYLIVLVLIPLGIALVLSLLTALPSMIKGNSYQAGETWRSEDRWFGGPRAGLEAAASKGDSGDSADKGGASAQW